MEIIKEKFELTLKDHKIEVIHKGFKLLKNQKNGLKDLKECIEQSIIVDENIEGFIPYNNFECSINWKIIEKKDEKKLNGFDLIDHLERRQLLDAQMNN